jgi:hypothetical protein
MNDKIKQLVDQATFHGDRYALPDEFADQLSKLIITECIKLCRQEWYDTNNDPALEAETDPRMIGIKIGVKQGALKCIYRIKDHFGVEE